MTLRVTDGLGGAAGCLGAALAPAEIAYAGGTLWASPFTLQLCHLLGGARGAAGEGSFAAAVTVPPHPGSVGLALYFQAAYVDSGAPQGISLTGGLQMIVDLP